MQRSRAYEKFCWIVDLTLAPDGYGLLLIADDSGRRHTLATMDVQYLCLLHRARGEPGSFGAGSR
ncbi:hypothetical protein [Streptomyces sp. NPDC001759]